MNDLEYLMNTRLLLGIGVFLLIVLTVITFKDFFKEEGFQTGDPNSLENYIVEDESLWSPTQLPRGLRAATLADPPLQEYASFLKLDAVPDFPALVPIFNEAAQWLKDNKYPVWASWVWSRVVIPSLWDEHNKKRSTYRKFSPADTTLKRNFYLYPTDYTVKDFEKRSGLFDTRPVQFRSAGCLYTPVNGLPPIFALPPMDTAQTTHIPFEANGSSRIGLTIDPKALLDGSMTGCDNKNSQGCVIPRYTLDHSKITVVSNYSNLYLNTLSEPIRREYQTFNSNGSLGPVVVDYIIPTVDVCTNTDWAFKRPYRTLTAAEEAAYPKFKQFLDAYKWITTNLQAINYKNSAFVWSYMKYPEHWRLFKKYIYDGITDNWDAKAPQIDFAGAFLSLKPSVLSTGAFYQQYIDYLQKAAAGDTGATANTTGLLTYKVNVKGAETSIPYFGNISSAAIIDMNKAYQYTRFMKLTNATEVEKSINVKLDGTPIMNTTGVTGCSGELIQDVSGGDFVTFKNLAAAKQNAILCNTVITPDILSYLPQVTQNYVINWITNRGKRIAEYSNRKTPIKMIPKDYDIVFNDKLLLDKIAQAFYDAFGPNYAMSNIYDISPIGASVVDIRFGILQLKNEEVELKLTELKTKYNALIKDNFNQGQLDQINYDFLIEQDKLIEELVKSEKTIKTTLKSTTPTVADREVNAGFKGRFFISTAVSAIDPTAKQPFVSGFTLHPGAVTSFEDAHNGGLFTGKNDDPGNADYTPKTNYYKESKVVQSASFGNPGNRDFIKQIATDYQTSAITDLSGLFTADPNYPWDLSGALYVKDVLGIQRVNPNQFALKWRESVYDEGTNKELPYYKDVERMALVSYRKNQDEWYASDLIFDPSGFTFLPAASGAACSFNKTTYFSELRAHLTNKKAGMNATLTRLGEEVKAAANNYAVERSALEAKQNEDIMKDFLPASGATQIADVSSNTVTAAYNIRSIERYPTELSINLGTMDKDGRSLLNIGGFTPVAGKVYKLLLKMSSTYNLDAYIAYNEEARYSFKVLDDPTNYEINFTGIAGKMPSIIIVNNEPPSSTATYTLKIQRVALYSYDKYTIPSQYSKLTLSPEDLIEALREALLKQEEVKLTAAQASIDIANKRLETAKAQQASIQVEIDAVPTTGDAEAYFTQKGMAKGYPPCPAAIPRAQFDPYTYGLANPTIAAELSYNLDRLRDHFMTIGIKQSKPIFPAWSIPTLTTPFTDLRPLPAEDELDTKNGRCPATPCNDYNLLYSIMDQYNTSSARKGLILRITKAVTADPYSCHLEMDFESIQSDGTKSVSKGQTREVLMDLDVKTCTRSIDDSYGLLSGVGDPGTGSFIEAKTPALVKPVEYGTVFKEDILKVMDPIYSTFYPTGPLDSGAVASGALIAVKDSSQKAIEEYRLKTYALVGDIMTLDGCPSLRCSSPQILNLLLEYDEEANWRTSRITKILRAGTLNGTTCDITYERAPLSIDPATNKPVIGGTVTTEARRYVLEKVPAANCEFRVVSSGPLLPAPPFAALTDMQKKDLSTINRYKTGGDINYENPRLIRWVNCTDNKTINEITKALNPKGDITYSSVFNTAVDQCQIRTSTQGTKCSKFTYNIDGSYKKVLDSAKILKDQAASTCAAPTTGARKNVKTSLKTPLVTVFDPKCNKTLTCDTATVKAGLGAQTAVYEVAKFNDSSCEVRISNNETANYDDMYKRATFYTDAGCSITYDDIVSTDKITSKLIYKPVPSDQANITLLREGLKVNTLIKLGKVLRVAADSMGGLYYECSLSQFNSSGVQISYRPESAPGYIYAEVRKRFTANPVTYFVQGVTVVDSLPSGLSFVQVTDPAPVTLSNPFVGITSYNLLRIRFVDNREPDLATKRAAEIINFKLLRDVNGTASVVNLAGATLSIQEDSSVKGLEAFYNNGIEGGTMTEIRTASVLSIPILHTLLIKPLNSIQPDSIVFITGPDSYNDPVKFTVEGSVNGILWKPLRMQVNPLSYNAYGYWTTPRAFFETDRVVEQGQMANRPKSFLELGMQTSDWRIINWASQKFYDEYSKQIPGYTAASKNAARAYLTGIGQEYVNNHDDTISFLPKYDTLSQGYNVVSFPTVGDATPEIRIVLKRGAGFEIDETQSGVFIGGDKLDVDYTNYTYGSSISNQLSANPTPFAWGTGYPRALNSKFYFAGNYALSGVNNDVIRTKITTFKGYALENGNPITVAGTYDNTTLRYTPPAATNFRDPNYAEFYAQATNGTEGGFGFTPRFANNIHATDFYSIPSRGELSSSSFTGTQPTINGDKYNALYLKRGVELFRYIRIKDMRTVSDTTPVVKLNKLYFTLFGELQGGRYFTATGGSILDNKRTYESLVASATESGTGQDLASLFNYNDTFGDVQISTGNTIQIQFKNFVVADAFSFLTNGDSAAYDLTGWKMESSIDGINWKLIQDRTITPIKDRKATSPSYGFISGVEAPPSAIKSSIFTKKDVETCAKMCTDLNVLQNTWIMYLKYKNIAPSTVTPTNNPFTILGAAYDPDAHECVVKYIESNSTVEKRVGFKYDDILGDCDARFNVQNVAAVINESPSLDLEIPYMKPSGDVLRTAMYIRFRPLKLVGGGQQTELSKFILLTSGGDYDSLNYINNTNKPVGSIQSLTGTDIAGAAVSNLVAYKDTSKWSNTTLGSVLINTSLYLNRYSGFTIVTGDDVNRAPIRWVLEASIDGSLWYNLHDQSTRDADIPDYPGQAYGKYFFDGRASEKGETGTLDDTTSINSGVIDLISKSVGTTFNTAFIPYKYSSIQLSPEGDAYIVRYQQRNESYIDAYLYKNPATGKTTVSKVVRLDTISDSAPLPDKTIPVNLIKQLDECITGIIPLSSTVKASVKAKFVSTNFELTSTDQPKSYQPRFTGYVYDISNNKCIYELDDFNRPPALQNIKQLAYSFIPGIGGTCPTTQSIAGEAVLSQTGFEGAPLIVRSPEKDSAGKYSFRYLRFTPIEIRGGSEAAAVSVSKFIFYKGTAASITASTTQYIATNPIGSWKGASSDLYESTTATAPWVDTNKTAIEFDLLTADQIVGFSWTTSNQDETNDPISWKVQASLDGFYWATVHDQSTPFRVTIERTCQMPVFFFNFPGEVPPKPLQRNECSYAESNTLETCSKSCGDADVVAMAVNKYKAATGYTLPAHPRTNPFNLTGYSYDRENKVCTYEYNDSKDAQITPKKVSFQMGEAVYPCNVISATKPFKLTLTDVAATAAAIPFSKPTARTNFSYVRFRPLELADPSKTAVNLNKILFFTSYATDVEDIPSSMTLVKSYSGYGLSCENPAGSDGGTAPNVIFTSEATPSMTAEWSDTALGSLLFTFTGTALSITQWLRGFTLITGSDSSRAPSKWVLESSTDGQVWRPLHIQATTPYDVPQVPFQTYNVIFFDETLNSIAYSKKLTDFNDGVNKFTCQSQSLLQKVNNSLINGSPPTVFNPIDYTYNSTENTCYYTQKGTDAGGIATTIKAVFYTNAVGNTQLTQTEVLQDYTTPLTKTPINVTIRTIETGFYTPYSNKSVACYDGRLLKALKNAYDPTDTYPLIVKEATLDTRLNKSIYKLDLSYAPPTLQSEYVSIQLPVLFGGSYPTDQDALNKMITFREETAAKAAAAGTVAQPFSTPAYFIRFKVLKTRNPDSPSVKVKSFTFYKTSSTGLSTITPIKVANPGGTADVSLAEGVELEDTAKQSFIFSFSTTSTLPNAISWTTNTDDADKDPIQWIIESSADGMSWATVLSQLEDAAMEDDRACLQDISVFGQATKIATGVCNKPGKTLSSCGATCDSIQGQLTTYYKGINGGLTDNQFKLLGIASDVANNQCTFEFVNPLAASTVLPTDLTQKQVLDIQRATIDVQPTKAASCTGIQFALAQSDTANTTITVPRKTLATYSIQCDAVDILKKVGAQVGITPFYPISYGYDATTNKCTYLMKDGKTVEAPMITTAAGEHYVSAIKVNAPGAIANPTTAVTAGRVKGLEECKPAGADSNQQCANMGLVSSLKSLYAQKGGQLAVYRYGLDTAENQCIYELDTGAKRIGLNVSIALDGTCTSTNTLSDDASVSSTLALVAPSGLGAATKPFRYIRFRPLKTRAANANYVKIGRFSFGNVSTGGTAVAPAFTEIAYSTLTDVSIVKKEVLSASGFSTNGTQNNTPETMNIGTITLPSNLNTSKSIRLYMNYKASATYSSTLFYSGATIKWSILKSGITIGNYEIPKISSTSGFKSYNITPLIFDNIQANLRPGDVLTVTCTRYLMPPISDIGVTAEFVYRDVINWPVTNPGGTWTGASTALLGPTATGFKAVPGSTVVFDSLSAGLTFNAYSFTTSQEDGSTDSDPVRWTLEASTDGVIWQIYDDRSGADQVVSFERGCDLNVWKTVTGTSEPLQRSECVLPPTTFTTCKKTCTDPDVLISIFNKFYSAKNIAATTSLAQNPFNITKIGGDIAGEKCIVEYDNATTGEADTIAFKMLPTVKSCDTTVKPFNMTIEDDTSSFSGQLSTFPRDTSESYRFIRFRPIALAGGDVETATNLSKILFYTGTNNQVTTTGMTAVNPQGTDGGTVANVINTGNQTAEWTQAKGLGTVLITLPTAINTLTSFTLVTGSQPSRAPVQWYLEYYSVASRVWKTLHVQTTDYQGVPTNTFQSYDIMSFNADTPSVSINKYIFSSIANTTAVTAANCVTTTTLAAINDAFTSKGVNIVFNPAQYSLTTDKMCLYKVGDSKTILADINVDTANKTVVKSLEINKPGITDPTTVVPTGLVKDLGACVGMDPCVGPDALNAVKGVYNSSKLDPGSGVDQSYLLRVKGHSFTAALNQCTYELHTKDRPSVLAEVDTIAVRFRANYSTPCVTKVVGGVAKNPAAGTQTFVRTPVMIDKVFKFRYIRFVPIATRDGGATKVSVGKFSFYSRDAETFQNYSRDGAAAAAAAVKEGFATWCPAGQYLMSNSCYPCPVGSYCPAGSTAPTYCPSGSYNPNKGSTSASACLKCPAGTYNSQMGYAKCDPCPTGTFNLATGATSFSTCLTCPAGFYCSTPASRVECSSGTYNTKTGQTTSGACLTCPAGSFCPNSSTRTLCAAGTYNSNTGSTTSGACLICPSGSFCPTTGTTNPTTCSLGSFCPSTGATGAGICPAGSYCPNVITQTPCPIGTYGPTTGAVTLGSCLSCPAGSYCPSAGATGATKCPSGTYNNVTGSTGLTACISCPAGSYCPAGSTGATPCPAGSFCQNTSSITQCLAGTYNPITGATLSSQCLTCPAGSYCPAGSTGPISCQAGTFNRNTGGTSITFCNICSTSQYCPPGSTNNALCPAGSYCPNSSTRTLCPAGTYNSIEGQTVEAACLTCIPGNYCPSPGTINNICPAGSYCPNIYTKIDCSIGSYCPAGSVQTTICPAGSYCPDPTTKIACPKGTFNPTSGATESGACLPCPEGYYCPTEGASSYVSCPPGYYCPDNTTVRICRAGYYCPSPTQEIICPAGSFCPSGATGPTLCAAGTYSDTTGRSSCLTCQYVGGYCPPGSIVANNLCPAGSYCPSPAVKTPCPAGTYNSLTGKTTSSWCYACSDGSYCPEGSAFNTTCQAGYYCPDRKTQLSCPAGTYSSSGQTSCTQCRAGSYNPNPIGTNSNVCLRCPAGSYCPAGSSGPILCAKGTYNPNQDQSSCFPCWAGYYCPKEGTAAAQTKCPAGTYSTTTGATSDETCLSCPAGTYCPTEASTGPTNCGVGKYASTTRNTSAATCLTCPSGAYCPLARTEAPTQCPAGTYNTATGATGAAACKACPAGNYCPTNNSAPIKCPAGTYNPSTNKTSVSECLPLSAGTYSTQTGLISNTGTACPAGIYCPPGSSELGTASKAGAHKFAPTERNIAGTIVTSEGDWDGATEEVYMGINPETSWTDLPTSALVFDFLTPQTIVGFSWITSNQNADYDPVQWRVEGSYDGVYWTTLHEQANEPYDVPTDRTYKLPIFYFNFENTPPTVRDNTAVQGFQNYKAPSAAASPPPPPPPKKRLAPAPTKSLETFQQNPVLSPSFGIPTQLIAQRNTLSQMYAVPLQQKEYVQPAFEQKASTAAAALAKATDPEPPAPETRLSYFKYLRFRPIKVRGGAASPLVSVGGFVFTDETGKEIQATRAIKVTNPMGTWSGKAEDVLGAAPAGQKGWDDFHKSPLLFAFPENKIISGYRLITSSKEAGADPVRWKLEGSQNGTYWEVLHDQSMSDFPMSNARGAQQAMIRF